MEFPDISKLHEIGKLPISTLVIYALIGIGTLIGSVLAYLKGKTEQSTPSQNLILREGSIADMGPIRDMAASLKELVEITKKQYENSKVILAVIQTELARKREEEVEELKEENMRLRLEHENLRNRRTRSRIAE